MTIHDIIQMEQQYVSLYSKPTQTPSGVIYFDAHQTDKYFHNYFHITEPIRELTDIQDYEQHHASYGFVIFRVDHDIETNDYFKDYDMSHYGYFHAKVTDLKLKETQFKPELVNPLDDQPFFDFMHQDDIQFGESYAFGNEKRQKEVLKQHPNTYFFIQIKMNDQVIGHLNAFTHDTFAKIDEFFVLESHQKQGYGSALMSDMVRRLTQMGITDVYLVTDLEDTAQELYRKMGYQFAGSFKQYQKIY
ncbi:GNAT family N-acetyltransferase [Methanobacterium sp. YSL]|nr:GNAT family N-acetyltransferase [Methanobacterium sp. YSL]